MQFIIWLDKYGVSPKLQPTDSQKTLLDVKVGDRVRWNRRSERMRVSLIGTYRTNMPEHGEMPIRSGRSYLKSMNAQLARG